jgi:DNA-binding transcriptional ArsR family regulator
MTSDHGDFKDRLYAQLARIRKALGSPHRIEMLELLAQSERTVDSLAKELGLSLANVSQRLQALRQAALVESVRKDCSCTTGSRMRACSWSTTGIMKIDLVGPSRRGLAWA